MCARARVRACVRVRVRACVRVRVSLFSNPYTEILSSLQLSSSQPPPLRPSSSQPSKLVPAWHNIQQVKAGQHLSAQTFSITRESGKFSQKFSQKSGKISHKWEKWENFPKVGKVGKFPSF